ncbi:hypothetical protein PG994_014246 [Apiospora phragmitis]|uniref:Uncharacterized protein n=1 Tax=Apiospora phragmitis TaxID=2905665 RepID=A0ABR1T5T3_9PEZI
MDLDDLDLDWPTLRTFLDPALLPVPNPNPNPIPFPLAHTLSPPPPLSTLLRAVRNDAKLIYPDSSRLSLGTVRIPRASRAADAGLQMHLGL